MISKKFSLGVVRTKEMKMARDIRRAGGERNASLFQMLLPREIFFTLTAIKGRRLLSDSKALGNANVWPVHP